jgi:hypothetical protein
MIYTALVVRGVSLQAVSMSQPSLLDQRDVEGGATQTTGSGRDRRTMHCRRVSATQIESLFKRKVTYVDCVVLFDIACSSPLDFDRKVVLISHAKAKSSKDSGRGYGA